MRTLSGLAAAMVLAYLAAAAPAVPAAEPPGGGYSVVVSRATAADAQWKAVVDALVAKHHAKVLEFETAVTDALPALRQEMPRYVCFVAPPAEATRDFVATVNRLMRRLDDDPYTDALWGILTGYDAAGALRIAQHVEPLVIRRAAAGTEIELARCDEGVWYCELNQGKMVRKGPGGDPQVEKAPPDTTKVLVDTLNEYKAQLFITSGHATERDWQIGYGYRNGSFRCQGGQLFGLDTQGRKFPVRSDNPKVYLPVGNCLMGHIDGPEAMALAFLHSAGVYQMIGYTQPTGYGYGGWGMLDYFLEQPGRFTAAEAFFVNQQALVHRLETYFPGAAKAAEEAAGKPQPVGRPPAFPVTLSPLAKEAGLSEQDARGLVFDSTVLAFYGDPAWEARLAPGLCNWDQTLTEKDGTFTFLIAPKLGEKTFKPVNRNGSQRGGRPIFQFLPRRIPSAGVRLMEGEDLKPVVTDNFLLVPLPRTFDPKRTYKVVFRAEGL